MSQPRPEPAKNPSTPPQDLERAYLERGTLIERLRKENQALRGKVGRSTAATLFSDLSPEETVIAQAESLQKAQGAVTFYEKDNRRLQGLVRGYERAITLDLPGDLRVIVLRAFHLRMAEILAEGGDLDDFAEEEPGSDPTSGSST